MPGELEQTSNRRFMISRGAAMIGTCLLANSVSPLKAQKAKKHTHEDGAIDVKKFGATGIRAQNATRPFRDAVAACVAGGGGTVNVSPGEYTIGTIQIQDNITLNIEAGATLYMSQMKDDFRPGMRSMIFAENATNIAVTGKGTLDGLAQYEYTEMRGIDVDISKEIELARAAGMDMRRYYRKSAALNAFMFVINNCTDFLLKDVTIQNSPLWNVRLHDCDRVCISRVHIYSDLEKGVNADGIDICSSANVTISDSVLVCGDDCIVLKTIARNGKKANPCQNVTVTNCILSSSSTPLMIGTETEADISNVLFNNCVIRNSNKGFGINVQDGATVSEVIISNITIETNRRHWNWWGNAEMCKFVLLKRKDSSPAGKIKNIVVENIIAHVRGTSTITGLADQPLENIRLSNIQLFMNAEDSKDKRASDALRVSRVKNLDIHNLSVNWSDETEDKWQSALVLDNVADFVIDSFSGRQGLKNGNHPAVLIDDATDGIIRNSRAVEDTGTFIHVRGDKVKYIGVKYNETRKAKNEITFATEAIQTAVTFVK